MRDDPPEAKHDGALVLTHDLDAAEEQRDERRNDVDSDHGSFLPASSSTSNSSAVDATDYAPARPLSIGVALRAFQISPRTRTRPVAIDTLDSGSPARTDQRLRAGAHRPSADRRSTSQTTLAMREPRTARWSRRDHGTIDGDRRLRVCRETASRARARANRRTRARRSSARTARRAETRNPRSRASRRSS